MDPDHDVCSVVSGPESNGVSDDFSKGSAGENHPIAQPNPSITIFAIEWIIQLCSVLLETGSN